MGCSSGNGKGQQLRKSWARLVMCVFSIILLGSEPIRWWAFKHQSCTIGQNHGFHFTALASKAQIYGCSLCLFYYHPSLNIFLLQLHPVFLLQKGIFSKEKQLPRNRVYVFKDSRLFLGWCPLIQSAHPSVSRSQKWQFKPCTVSAVSVQLLLSDIFI